MPQAQAQIPGTSPAPANTVHLPLAGRSVDLQGFQRAADSADPAAPLATARICFAAGAAVRRYDWYRERPYDEVLVVEEGAVRLGRLERGAPLLNTHNSYALEAVLGVVDSPVVANGQAEANVAFSRRASVAGYVKDVEDRIIRNVSAGYIRHAVEMVPPGPEGGIWQYRVVDWEPHECSLVPIPADMDAQVRSAGPDHPADPAADAARDTRTFPCVFTEAAAPSLATRSMPTAGPAAATSTLKETTMPGPTTAAGAAAPAQDQAALTAAEQAGHASATQRAADIAALCVRHGMADQAATLVASDKTVDQVRAQILDGLATRDAQGGGQRNVTSSVVTVNDEMVTRMAGIENALAHRVDSRVKLDDNGRQYRGMSLLEVGRDLLAAHGVNTRGMDRMELAQRMLHFRSGMHTTSDFASLFANVANKRLRGAYDEHLPTYTMWARRAPNAPDFKTMQVTVLSGAPDLLQTNEAGEFKYGTMSDGKETYGVLTYGRIVPLSRQAIVNDDLRGFDRLVTAFGFSARRLENRTVYSQLTANAALSDAVALFHATHANLGTGGGSALAETSLGAGRSAMRLQKGLQSEELNLKPDYLIVPSALEQTAYKLTSNQFVPATTSAINEFRAGGRTAVEPVVESVLDASSATAWYLAANSNQVDTVEYCYLDGAEGVVIESEPGFEVDGVSFKARLDFAAKAIDFRGLYKANGA